MPVTQGHPFYAVEEIKRQVSPDARFTYSIYEVAPPGSQAQAPRTDELRIRAVDLTTAWLTARLDELGPRQELAWHSKVDSNEETFHWSMLARYRFTSARF
jgi:hypothetical protein